MLFWIPIFHRFIKFQVLIMTNNVEIVSAAVSLIIKAALLAARFSGRARKRSLKRLSKMDADSKDKEILFLRDTVSLSPTPAILVMKFF